MMWTALIMGLAASAHCLVMCGPLVLGIQAKGVRTLLYHGGRLLAYTGLGLLFGLLGRIISLSVYQQGISILAGILLLLGAIFFFVFRGPLGFVLSAWSRQAAGLYVRLKRWPANAAVLARGVINGLLPCGMVYLAATASLQAGSLQFSMLYMLLFGLGTLPAMLSIALLGKVLHFRWRSIISKTAPYLAILIAFLFIVRGLALDIPYLSPKITVENSALVKGCCSHCKR